MAEIHMQCLNISVPIHYAYEGSMQNMIPVPATNPFESVHCMESSKDVAEHQEIHLVQVIAELFR